jgi:protein-S-isoprenylcysteine O-methyltransferase Ste14
MSGEQTEGSFDDGRRHAFGARGEGWVALQFVLIGVAGVAGLVGPRWPRATRGPRVAAAVPLLLAGAALMAAGSRGLGRELTILPRPPAGGSLKREGAYGLVRHPIYGGAILTSWAWVLVSSPLALVSVALAAPFYEAKRRREEAWLVEQFPEYAEYARQVPRRFIPFVW